MELWGIPPALLAGGGICFDTLIRCFHARGDHPGLYDFFPAAVADGFRQRDMKVVATGRPIVSEEWLHIAGDGQAALFEVTRTPIPDGNGQVVGLVGIGHDITERHRMTDQIQALALHDVLTRLPNRRLLYDHLGKVRATCRRRQRPKRHWWPRRSGPP